MMSSLYDEIIFRETLVCFSVNNKVIFLILNLNYILTKLGLITLTMVTLKNKEKNLKN